MKRWYVVIMAVMAIAVVMVIVGAVDPMGHAGRWLPKCPLKWITGFDCPGCGATRALHFLLTGQPGSALRANYFLPVALLMAIISAVAELAPYRLAGLRRLIFSPIVTCSFAAATMLWWIVRNMLEI